MYKNNKYRIVFLISEIARNEHTILLVGNVYFRFQNSYACKEKRDFNHYVIA